MVHCKRIGPAGRNQKEDGLDSKVLALAIAEAALDKQATSVEIMNIAQKVSYADYVVICSGRSSRQVEAIVNGVEVALRALSKHPLGIEGKQGGQWVLMDYGDVVFHVFEDQNRGFYDLDGLWIDAERVPLREASTGRDEA